MDRYVILAVEYEHRATDGERSLEWLVPELADAGLSLTEDTRRLRKWVGGIGGDTYTRLADGWDLGNKTNQPNVGMLTEYGELGCHAYAWDGMEWERAGASPIVSMNLRVSEPIEAGVAAHGWFG